MNGKTPLHVKFTGSEDPSLSSSSSDSTLEGTFVFAPLTQWLLTEYGWRGTTLILAGLFLNLCVCGMLMRDLAWTKAKRKERRRKRDEKAATASSVDTYSAASVAAIAHTPTSCPSIEEHNQPEKQDGLPDRKEHLSAKFLQEPVITSPTNEPWWTKPHSAQAARSLSTAHYLKDLRVHRSWYAGLYELGTLLSDMLEFRFFLNIRFLLFAISNFLLYTWYDVPYVYLADYAIEQGYPEGQASMLIAGIGIVNMVGEIALGWAGDLACVNPNLVYACCMFMCGAVVSLVPLVDNYYGLAALAGAFGLFIAANYALTSIILVELITIERFTNAYGLLLLVQGIANLIGPPLAVYFILIKLPRYFNRWFEALVARSQPKEPAYIPPASSVHHKS
ncbi:unnamed protein product [Nesidiocoris tenuis]|uniref:Major facilitator superfamily (MFS) profile domain-containing protein n=2 Tax=Nesidiocoris tenuis TaxID=355587 RepID=A0A6H5G7P2_9HEMI|nr:unnamed protein product [Nesidiocoris tenuis]